MNPWDKYEKAINEGNISIEIFKDLLTIAKEAKYKEYILSQKIKNILQVINN